MKSEIRNKSIEIVDSRICAIRSIYWESMLNYMGGTTFLTFVITILYIFMGITLYKSTHQSLNNGERKMINDHSLRETPSSLIKSGSIRNSRGAALKMLGKGKSEFEREECL